MLFLPVDEFDAGLDDEFENFAGANKPKSMLPLFLYKILQQRSDRNRPLTHKKLIAILCEYPYEITVERKAIGRTLQIIHQLYPEIRLDRRRGAWYEEPPEIG